ncbi:MAG: YbjQ family protein [Planctomycetota bacterium]
MIVSTTNEIPGRRTLEILGVARGAAIRSRHFGHSLLAFFRGLVGGEIVDYTKVIAETREQAFDRMVDDAKRMGANALLAVRFSSIEVMRNAAEIVVYGTAAVIEEVQQEE